MSVSSRSPTTSGRLAPVRATASACSGGSGLPATTGCCPVACAITWTSEPLPGCTPARRRQRGVGVGGHEPGAGPDGQPALGQQRVADVRARSPGPPRRAGPRPWRPAAGRARAAPGAARCRRRPAPATPAGSRSAISLRRRLRRGHHVGWRARARRCRPAARRWRDGVRDALLVTNASRMPRLAALASASGAPGTAAAAQVDDAVQVEQGGVVGLALSGSALPRGSSSPRGRTEPGSAHRRSGPLRCRSPSRVCRLSSAPGPAA